MQKPCKYFQPGDPASCQRGDECGFSHLNIPLRRYTIDRPASTSPSSPSFVEERADSPVIVPPISFFARPVGIPPPDLIPQQTATPLTFKPRTKFDLSKYRYVAPKVSPQQQTSIASMASLETSNERESSQATNAGAVNTSGPKSMDKGKVDLVYSQRLTDATIELFKQETYQRGYIPLVPPTKDLI
ncbi:unnamed protein product, partial [Mesorhabditis belari]|uniref:C3H1-type domain-containing protein n=1 Tax=Mesorhabditis belari TaxID=2138241 RepID=A0AAF3EGQ7_9BILA